MEATRVSWLRVMSFTNRCSISLVPSQDPRYERGGSLGPENYNNRGAGKAYGWELFLRYARKPWTAWLSYTLSQSLRSDPDHGQYNYSTDNKTHILTALAQVNLPHNWTLGGRTSLHDRRSILGWRMELSSMTTEAYTVPRIPGGYYASRLPRPFFSLDFRVDKKWMLFNTWTFSIYLDIQNITNAQNPEAITYSFDF